MEKTASTKFSICVFGSVSVLGSQTISLRTPPPYWLTPSIFLRLPYSRQISPIPPYISRRSCSLLPASENRCGWLG